MRAVLFLLLLLLPTLAAADRVTVKGTVLEGTVKRISGGSIVMSTVYGKGDLTIPTEDVSAIETDAPFHFYKADDGVAEGRVVGISPTPSRSPPRTAARRKSLSATWRPRRATTERRRASFSGVAPKARGGAGISTLP